MKLKMQYNKLFLSTPVFILYFLSILFNYPILVFKLAVLSGIALAYLQKKQIIPVKVLADLLILLGFTSISLLISSFINQEQLRIESFLIIGIIIITGYVAGTLIRVIKVQDEYKTAFILGLLILIIESESRRFGEGWFAVATLFGFIIGAVIISGMKVNAKIYVLWGLYIFPTLFLNLIFGPLFGKLLIFPILTIAIILSYFIIERLNPAGMSMRRKIVFSILTILLISPSWILQENYSHWRYVSLNQHIETPINYNFITENGDTLSSADQKGKVVVCLFWSAYCGRCSKEYPEFSKLAKQFKERDDVAFYAVFISFAGKDSVYFNSVAEQKFEFDWVKSRDGKELFTSLQMVGVPHLSIFDKESNVIYNGWVRDRPWIFVKRPERIINQLLE
jgi:thioredoxin-related protein